MAQRKNEQEQERENGHKVYSVGTGHKLHRCDAEYKRRTWSFCVTCKRLLMKKGRLENSKVTALKYR